MNESEKRAHYMVLCGAWYDTGKLIETSIGGKECIRSNASLVELKRDESLTHQNTFSIPPETIEIHVYRAMPPRTGLFVSSQPPKDHGATHIETFTHEVKT